MRHRTYFRERLWPKICEKGWAKTVDKVITILVAVLVPVVEALRQGAVDFHKINSLSLVLVWGGVFLVYIAQLYVRSQLEIHAEDQRAIIASRNAAQSHRLFEQLSYIKESLQALDPNVCQPLQVSGLKIAQWELTDIFKDRFQQQYKIVRSFAASAGLDIRKDNTMKDPVTLYDFPCHFSHKEVKENIEEYSEGLRIYAAKEDAELVKVAKS
ncbi:MAG: hypothetical protein ABSE86_37445 [Bryobacteraceae bacterium]